jgi:ABC-type transport system involved in multi-copper enzyme maturation permease subunit
MSSEAETKAEGMPMPNARPGSNRSAWPIWRAQIAAIMRLEIRKNFLGKRGVLIYLLVFGQVLLAAVAFPQLPTIRGNIGEANMVGANMYEGVILRTVVFFGCAWIFMNLFRGEMVDKSLHYYLLAPVRREVLLAGKYISGLLVSIVLFTIATVGTLFFLYLAVGSPANTQYLFHGPGLIQVLSYVEITWLAAAGYGAFFLIVGLFFRNPIIPAILIYGWEWINFLLPPVLKKISIIHYLHSLTPVPVSEGPFALVAEPTPGWLSITGLLVVCVVVLLLAAVRIRRLEIKYT